MSSYGNHVWTQARQDIADKLVAAAADCDDDGFAEIMHTSDIADLIAVTALLAEQLADLRLELLDVIT